MKQLAPTSPPDNPQPLCWAVPDAKYWLPNWVQAGICRKRFSDTAVQLSPPASIVFCFSSSVHFSSFAGHWLETSLHFERKKWGGGGGHLRSYDWMEESAGMMILLFYNPGQKSLGDEYCNIHIFLSVLGYLLKQCILFEILLQFSLSPPYTKLKHGKNSGYTRPTLFVGWGWTCVNWKTPQKRKSVPRLLSMIVGQFYAKVINFMPLHI